MNPPTSAREEIRRALAQATSATPGRAGGRPGSVSAPDARTVLPRVGRTADELLAQFRRNADELRASFRMIVDRVSLASAVRLLAAKEGWRRVAIHPGTLTDSVGAALGLPLCSLVPGYDVATLEACDVGITECDALIAQTGSVLLTSRSAGGRALSVLPPHHVVLARRDQLVPGLPEAFALLRERYGPDYPSMISFVTGPSRTGDIERILVLGAHGPKQLTILCA